MAFICCSMYDKTLDACIGQCGGCDFTADVVDNNTWLLHGVYCMLTKEYMKTYFIIRGFYYGI